MNPRPFTFSCDAHVVEPLDLYKSNIPAHLHDHTLSVQAEDGFLCTYIGDKRIYKVPLIIFDHKVGAGTTLGEGSLMKPQGSRDLKKRLADMAQDGIDAELIFPTVGLMGWRIESAEAAVAHAHVWNDWAWDYFDGLRNAFVPAAFLPMGNWEDLKAEIRRVLGKGYTALMLPALPGNGIPGYTDPGWDGVFAMAAEADATFVIHIATGNAAIKALGGPGGAIYNYARQMCDAIDATMRLVAGGVLDRNPGAKVAFIESGASWLAALAERMDEVEEAHANFVFPKLSRRCSQIIDDQVWASFQHDRSCIVAANAGLAGAKNVMWGSDYPHAEGTFPISRRIVDDLFEGLNVSDECRLGVLGLNAARLFRIDPVVQTSEKLAA